MPANNEKAWRKLMLWQGEMNATVKNLSDNQDELRAHQDAFLSTHYACREEILARLVGLETIAKQEGKRWGIIAGIISGIIVAVISTVIIWAITGL